MIAALILLAGIWFFPDNGGERICYTSLGNGVYTDCVIKLREEKNPDTGVMEAVWEYRGVVFKGNPYCVETQLFPQAPEAQGLGACVVI